MAVEHFILLRRKSICWLVLLLCVLACVFWSAKSEVSNSLNEADVSNILESPSSGDKPLTIDPLVTERGENEVILERNRRAAGNERETKRSKARKRENRKKIAIATVGKIVEETLSRELEPLKTAFKIIRLETFSESVLRQLENVEQVQSKILTEYGELRAAITEVGRHTMDLGRQVAGLDERLASLDRHLPHRMNVLGTSNSFLADGNPLSGMLQMTETVKDAMLSVTNRITTAERRFREDLTSLENTTLDANAANQVQLVRRLATIAKDTETIRNSIDNLSIDASCSPTTKSAKETRSSSFFPRSFSSPPNEPQGAAPQTAANKPRDELVYLPADERSPVADAHEREERQHPPSITPFKNWIRPAVTEVQPFSSAMVQKLASEIVKHIGTNGGPGFRPKDCQDVADHGQLRSGVHTIYPASCTRRFAVEVWCELEITGEGWTVIQRRGPWNEPTLRSSSLGIPLFKDTSPSVSSMSTSVDFFRDWAEYKWGFGDLKGEYWLGNEYTHQMTQSGDYELKVELEDWNSELKWAKYSHFSLGDEEHNYTLHIGDYTGDAGNSLKHHRTASFSTKDRDNDSNPRGHCARTFHGAWWFTSCHESHLNGRYHKGRHKSFGDGINWLAFRGHNYSLKKSRMMIRPTQSKA